MGGLLVYSIVFKLILIKEDNFPSILNHLSFPFMSPFIPPLSSGISVPRFPQNNSDCTFNPGFRHHSIWEARPGSTPPVMVCSLLWLHLAYYSRNNCSRVFLHPDQCPNQSSCSLKARSLLFSSLYSQCLKHSEESIIISWINR